MLRTEVLKFVIQSDQKLKYNLKRFITFHSGYTLENELLHNSGPALKFLFTGARCGFHVWCGTRSILMQSLPILHESYLHRHSLLHHGFWLAVLFKIVTEEEHKLCLWRSLRNENQRVWGWVTMAWQNPWCGNECRWRSGTQSTGQDCIQKGRVSHHSWKPHRAPVNKNLNVGPLLWGNSFSNMWPD
jgi:hypothetical protein